MTAYQMNIKCREILNNKISRLIDERQNYEVASKDYWKMCHKIDVLFEMIEEIEELNGQEEFGGMQ